jgi:hypothetical protein
MGDMESELREIDRSRVREKTNSGEGGRGRNREITIF